MSRSAGNSEPLQGERSNGAQPQVAQPHQSGRRERREERPVTGAGGVVFDPSGKVLLLKHVSGHWVFPKGHLDAGEDALQAALREVAEEAGVNAACEHPEQHWLTRYRNSRNELREITWFHCHTNATEVRITEDLFIAGGFFTPSAATEMLAHSEDRELLRKVSAAGRERGE